MGRRLLGLAMAVLLGPICGLATGENTDQPPLGKIIIQGDQMTLKQEDNQILFEGHVIVRKEDVTLEADRVVAYFGSKPDPPHRKSASPSETAKEISHLEMTGHVKMRQGNRHAEAEMGVYDRAADSIVLSGAPVAWEGGYRVKGREMTFSLGENRTRIEEGEVEIDMKALPRPPP